MTKNKNHVQNVWNIFSYAKIYYKHYEYIRQEYNWTQQMLTLSYKFLDEKTYAVLQGVYDLQLVIFFLLFSTFFQISFG